MEGDKYSIGWSTFHNHLFETNTDLFQHKDFTDVTLVSDDLLITNAHKFVLSSSSTIFKKLLSIDCGQKPIIFLKGVSSQDLESILQFIYLGETHVDMDRVNSFLVSAKNLAIKKITGDDINPADFNLEAFHNSQLFKKEVVEENIEVSIHQNIDMTGKESQEMEHETVNNCDQNSLSNDVTGKRFLESKKTDNTRSQETSKEPRNRDFSCQECPYQALTRNSLRIHVKSIHLLERHPCTQCTYQATQKANLNRHMKMNHADSWGHKM